MPRDIEKIKRVFINDNMRDGYTDSHPAFGQVCVIKGHRQGNCNLYGTSLRKHPATFTISISESKRDHHLSRDWYHSRKELIEIELSAAQFIGMIAEMNMGDGFPCTIRRFNGKLIPDIPDEDVVEVDRVCDGFKEQMDKTLKELREGESRAVEILGQKSIKVSDKKELQTIVEKASNFLWNHAPFIMDSFAESADKVKEEMKHEVDSFISMVTEKAGIKALSEMTKPEQVALLTGKEKDDE
jgi:hypothetical protein